MEKPKQNDGMIYLRWLLVLPCAALVYVIGWAIVVIIGYDALSFVTIDPRSPLARRIIAIIGNILMPLFFVFTGLEVAPSHRKKAGLILALILFGWKLFFLITNTRMRVGFTPGGHIWGLVVTIGMIILLYKAKESDSDI